MRPTRKAAKRSYTILESSDEDVKPKMKKSPPPSPLSLNLSEDSSSESEIETNSKSVSEVDHGSSSIKKSTRTPYWILDSDDDDKPKKKSPASSPPTLNLSEDSSSESEIENNFQLLSKIDHFKNALPQPNQSQHGRRNNLSDSSTENDEIVNKSSCEVVNKVEIETLHDTEIKNDLYDQEMETPSTSTINFDHITTYNKHLEEARKYIERYKAKRALEENPLDVSKLLEIGERKIEQEFYNSLGSGDFFTLSDSDKDDWEEVEDKEDKSRVHKDVEITINTVPNQTKKKKQLDLMDIVKRKINRIKRENQVYVHKVHLLCWIAHGISVNKVLNNQNLLGIALSLLPSQHCYPSNRLDLTYLENIVTWYGKAMRNNANPKDCPGKLEESLADQLTRKHAYNNKMFVYMFICVLRALGIKCRLVLSLQLEPLRPPTSELCVTRNKKDNVLSGKVKKSDISSKKLSIAKLESCETNTSRKVELVQKVVKPVPTRSMHSRKLLKESTAKEAKMSLKDKLHCVQTSETKILRKQSKAQDDPIVDVQKTECKSENKRKGISVKQEISEESPKRSRKSQIASIETASQKGVRYSVGANKVTLTEKQIDLKQKREIYEKNGKKIRNPRNTVDKDRRTTENSKSSERNRGSSDKIGTRTRRRKEIGDKESKLQVGNSKERTRRNTDRKVNTNTTKKDDGRSNLKEKNTEQAKNIPQVDGNADSDSSVSSTRRKPNLKKLKTSTEKCAKAHPERLKSIPKHQDVAIRQLPPRRASKSKTNPKNTPKPSTSKYFSPPDGERSRFFELSSNKKQLDIRNDILSLVFDNNNPAAGDKHKTLSRVKRKVNNEDNDGGYAPAVPNKKTKNALNKTKVKRRIPMKKDLLEIEKKKIEEKVELKKSKGDNVWLEVFAEAEEKWISVDVIRGKVHCVEEIYSKASHPISYILGFDNDSRIKDLTKRYCVNWNTVTRRLRVDEDWWQSTVKPYRGVQTARDREEDEDLAKQELDQPLPTTISEYKNHSLYVLKRHLLKFEAVYPSEALILGFVKNEPVYSRDCVYTLHSREIWVKHAKVVKAGETPYKIVKARPKYDKLSGTVITDQDLEVFGPWQVEDYVPPTAENGIVPRNAYGNVELFKSCMLPKGTVHLQLPGLNKVARKLNIDCAPAVVGFDFHAGGSHPTFDGFVVCEEISEALVAAYFQEQEEVEKKAREKTEKRIYGNWRKLIRGLLIRERLKLRYDFGEPASSKESNTSKKKNIAFVTKKR